MSSGPATQAGKAKPEKVWVCRPHTPIVDCRYDKRKGNPHFSPQVAGILWIPPLIRLPGLFGGKCFTQARYAVSTAGYGDGGVDEILIDSLEPASQVFG